MVTIQFIESFKRRLKKLAKCYRNIKTDVQPVLQQAIALRSGESTPRFKSISCAIAYQASTGSTTTVNVGICGQSERSWSNVSSEYISTL